MHFSTKCEHFTQYYESATTLVGNSNHMKRQVCDVKYLYTLHCIGIIYLFIYYYYLCVLIKLDISSNVFSCLLIYFA